MRLRSTRKSISYNRKVSATSATRPLSSYEQHKVDAGNNTENINNEDTSIEEQRAGPSPSQANEAEEQHTESCTWKRKNKE